MLRDMLWARFGKWSTLLGRLFVNIDGGVRRFITDVILTLLHCTGDNIINLTIQGGTQQASDYYHKTGLLSQAQFSTGDEITVPYRDYSLIFRIVDLQNEVLTLEMKYVFGSSSAYKGLQFDAPEAFYYAESGLVAGTYNFTLLAGYDTTYGGGKTFQFTLTQAVPVGGVLTFPWGYNVQASTIKVYSWASNSDTTGIENVAVTEGTGGTSLGEVNGTGNLNHTHRVRYGSNNYAQSAIRQWLNSSASLGSVWTPKTKFDRPPTSHTSTDAAYVGFKNGLDADFLAVVESATIPYRTNGVNEVASLDGTAQAINTVYNLSDKFFLLSRPEIYGTWDNTTYKDGELLDYYNGLTDAERKKYDAFGSVRAAWLRSPHPGVATNARVVHTDGKVINPTTTTANNSYGVAAACKVTSQNLKKIIDDNVVTYSPATTPNYTMPSPDRVSSIVSNLPAGTYKVADYWGHWYEFTLSADLCGIGTVLDSIEFDRIGHVGYDKREIISLTLDGVTEGKMITVVSSSGGYYYGRITIPKPLSAIPGTLLNTHFKNVYSGQPGNVYIAGANNDGLFMYHTDQTLDTVEKWNTWLASNPITVAYQLNVPTRTPLTFTLNDASTAPECPMQFLTSTPSLEYPAGVYDASGTVTASNSDESESATATIETLRSNAAGTVYDEQNVTTGAVTRRIGRIESYNGEEVGDDWVSSTGALDTGAAVVYALDEADYTTETVTPQELPTYEGTTIISVDSIGQPTAMTAEYWATEEEET